MNGKTGFSLMEVLIAMVLLAAVGAATMHSFSSSVQVTQSDASVAYNFARGQMEQLYERVRRDEWGTGGLPLSLATSPARPSIPNKSLNGDTYAATYTVNNDSGQPVDVDGDGIEDYRRVTMSVTW